MRRSLAIACVAAMGLVAADAIYWGWLLGTKSETADLPHWQLIFDTVTAFGGTILLALVALVVLVHAGAQAFCSGARLRLAWRRRRHLNELLRRL